MGGRRYSYEEVRECIELQFSDYYSQCMCGHEFQASYRFEKWDEGIWDELYEEESYN